jgi:hypothetical protein
VQFAEACYRSMKEERWVMMSEIGSSVEGKG